MKTFRSINVASVKDFLLKIIHVFGSSRYSNNLGIILLYFYIYSMVYYFIKIEKMKIAGELSVKDLFNCEWVNTYARTNDFACCTNFMHPLPLFSFVTQPDLLAVAAGCAAGNLLPTTYLAGRHIRTAKRHVISNLGISTLYAIYGS